MFSFLKQWAYSNSSTPACAYIYEEELLLHSHHFDLFVFIKFLKKPNAFLFWHGTSISTQLSTGMRPLRRYLNSKRCLEMIAVTSKLNCSNRVLGVVQVVHLLPMRFLRLQSLTTVMTQWGSALHFQQRAGTFVGNKWDAYAVVFGFPLCARFCISPVSRWRDVSMFAFSLRSSFIAQWCSNHSLLLGAAFICFRTSLWYPNGLRISFQYFWKFLNCEHQTGSSVRARVQRDDGFVIEVNAKSQGYMALW